VSMIDSITRGALGFRADVGGTPAPWDDYWYTPLGLASSTGMRITPETAKRVAAVLACVGIIARNLGMLPCKIYTDMPDGGKKLVDHHPVYDVLYSRPNDHQTAFEFKQMMQAHVELRGNAYAEILPGPRGAVDQLIPMHPDRVMVEVMKPSGRLRYVYNDPLTNSTRRLMEGEVFHLRNFSDNGYTGQSTVEMACDVFGVALAAQDYQARFFANDARPGGIVTGTNFKNDADADKFTEKFEKKFTGKNRHKVWMLPAGLDYKEIGVKPSDAQLLDAQKLSRIQICSLFPVPPHLIGETEKTATYASVEQFNIMFSTQCILPRLVMWEQAIQRDLIQNPRYFAKFSLAALLRGDTASRYAAFKIAIENGWLSPDEARAMDDMNPIPGGIGKTYWRQANMVPLGQLGSGAPGAPASTDPEDPDAQETESTAAPADDAEEQAKREAELVAHNGRLQLLAASAADRCLRREVNGVRRLVERNASNYEIEEFYGAQEKFLLEVLHLPEEAHGDVRAMCRQRADALDELLRAENRAGAIAWVEALELRESTKLANIAMKGAA
jgi:HK97 family phage portal protein